MDHLERFFNQELKNMKVFCYNKVDKVKYKRLTFALSSITTNHKKAVLKQYFSLCKMVYRIRAAASYIWDQGSNQLEVIKQKYNEDQTFAKMVRIAKKNITTVFADTDPAWVILGDNFQKIRLRITSFVDENTPENKNKLLSKKSFKQSLSAFKLTQVKDD